MGRGNQGGGGGGGGKGNFMAAPPVVDYRKQLGRSEKHREKLTRRRVNRVRTRRRLEEEEMRLEMSAMQVTTKAVEKSSSKGFIFLLLLCLSLIVIGVNLAIYFGLKHEHPHIQVYISLPPTDPTHPIPQLRHSCSGWANSTRIASSPGFRAWFQTQTFEVLQNKPPELCAFAHSSAFLIKVSPVQS